MFPTSYVPLCGIKFRFKDTLPQTSCDDNKKAIGMPEIKVVMEVAGRICVFPVEVGRSVAGGDDVATVEVMKKEGSVPSPAAGTIKSPLVEIAGVVAEGQAVAIVAS